MLFELRPDGPEPFVVLPYRMIFAVATRSSVVLYDTQQIAPFAVISNIHYTRLTDLTWSQDGRILAVSSTDGFCSLVSFEANELGTEYVKEESDEENMEISVNEEVLNETVPDEKVEDKKEPKKNSFLKQWATNKRGKKVETDLNEPVKEKDVILIQDSPPSKKFAAESKKNVPVNLIQVKRYPSVVGTKPEISDEIPKNSTPAKPIAVRRKPRDQMNITTFLKTPTEPVNKPESSTTEENKVSSVSLEDSTAQDAWKDRMEVDETKQPEIIEIEDSQDIKLVLDETNCDGNQDVKNTESPEQNLKENNSSEANKRETAENDLIQVESTSNEIDSKIVCTDNSDKCDVDSTENKKVIKDINKQIDEIQLQTPKRKKVPFITLSSPRNKKKDNS